MCVIVAQPEGARLQKSAARNCYLNNPDGAGFAFVKDGEVYISKGFKSFPHFWREYKRRSKDLSSPFLLHFRIATVGDVNIENTHPFPSTLGSAFAHNGTMHSFKEVFEGYSDSRNVAELLRQLKMDITTYSGRVMLKSILGSTNKGVFLLPNKQFVILNAAEGEVNNGIWYSNNSYRRERKVVEVTSNRQTVTCPSCKQTKFHLTLGDLCWQCRYAKDDKGWDHDASNLGLLEEDDDGLCFVCQGYLLQAELDMGLCMLCASQINNGETIYIS